MGYSEFLRQKSQIGMNDGFKPVHIPDYLFDFQKQLVEWAILKGRGALFEDCGLGKTAQYLAWADNVVRHTNKPVLILTPMAVAQQTVREAEKFGIEAKLSIDGVVKSGINVANYERLHYFDPNDFVAIVCDESAVLKSFDSTRKQQITDAMKKMKYRLLCTATPSPNEYIELGTSSEALGHLGYMDMLSKFFKNNQGNSIKPFKKRNRGEDHAKNADEAKWRFKGHAEDPFWRWVCSWARAVRKPSDIGFDDGPYVLPELTENQHMVDYDRPPDGMLFSLPAFGLKEQREERRRTIEERVEKASSLVNNTGRPAIVWCHLNDEGDMLEKNIPDGVQVSGKDSEEKKEEKLLSFIDGKSRVLIIKPKIGAWGLNFQHCAHMVTFPDHSFEQYYQGVRRCWRFGQKNPVTVDVVTTEGEKDILKNLQRKAMAADKMFAGLIEHMNQSVSIDRTTNFKMSAELPKWM